MIKYIGKFIGQRKIVEVKDAKRKTYLGRNVVEVKFDDKTSKEYPEEILKVIAIKEKTDLTALRDLTAKPTAEKIMAILVESELPISNPVEANIYYLLQDVLPEHIQEKTRLGTGKSFGKDYYDINLMDINQAITNGKSEDKN